MHKVYLKPGKEDSLKRFHPLDFFLVPSPTSTANPRKVK